jgi:hypothetical protein
MGYIIKAPTGGGGGGDATAANQLAQISQIANTTAASVFKDTTISKSVFTSFNGQQSLFYKSIENTGPAIAINPNVIQSISFTDVTAAGVSGLLNTWLSTNPCFICGLTATQSIGSHDLYLLYST